MNRTLNELRPRVKQLDPSVIDLTPITQELEVLEQDSENMKRKVSVNNLYYCVLECELNFRLIILPIIVKI